MSTYDNLRVCVAYPNRFAVSETFVRNHIEGLQPVVSVYEGFYPAKTSEDLPILPFPYKHLAFRGTFRNLLPSLYHKKYTALFADFLRKNKIDAVMGEYGPMGCSLLDACEKAGAGMVVHFHGFDAFQYDVVAQYKQRYLDMFKRIQAVVVVSRDMKDELARMGCDANKIHYVSCGVDVHKFGGAQPSKADKLVVCVGRFTEKKAPYLTIKSFQKVVTKNPEAKLIMIGSGELFDDCKKLVTELHLTESVQLMGSQPPEVIADTLKKARVYVQHSKRAPNGDSEGTPVSVLEGGATGLPIISTLHGGIKDAVIHNETGYLVPEGDVDQMAFYIDKLLNDPALAEEMGKKGREHISNNFSMERQIRLLKEAVEQAAQKK